MIQSDIKGKKIFVDFDGVYMDSEVWINGTSLGKRPYGYISFRYDLTPYIKFGQKNVIAVRVDNSEQPNSRWYSGCGIYRNVWLTIANPIHAEAVKQAANADLIIFVGGLNKNNFQDCENADRKSLALPFGQTELINDLLKVNKNMVVVLLSGNAVEMPWIAGVFEKKKLEP